MSNTISNIQRNSATYKPDAQKAEKGEKAEKAGKPEESNQSAIRKQDAVVIGSTTETPVTYTKPGYKLSAEDIKQIKGQEQQNLMHLRNLVRQLILKQNKDFDASNEIADLTDILQTGEPGTEAAGMEVSGTGAALQLEPAAAIDDEYGVEAVSDRIVNFAIFISGGDKSKLDQLIGAIEEGFSQAAQAFGKELPDICSQTHDAIMQKLDAWKNEA